MSDNTSLRQKMKTVKPKVKRSEKARRASLIKSMLMKSVPELVRKLGPNVASQINKELAPLLLKNLEGCDITLSEPEDIITADDMYIYLYYRHEDGHLERYLIPVYTINEKEQSYMTLETKLRENYTDFEDKYTSRLAFFSHVYLIYALGRSFSQTISVQDHFTIDKYNELPENEDDLSYEDAKDLIIRNMNKWSDYKVKGPVLKSNISTVYDIDLTYF